MSAVKLTAQNLKKIAEASRASNISFFEKCALYSASKVLVEELRVQTENRDGSLKLYGMARDAGWHIGVMLGFEEGSQCSLEQEYIWALTHLDNLEAEE